MDKSNILQRRSLRGSSSNQPIQPESHAFDEDATELYVSEDEALDGDTTDAWTDSGTSAPNPVNADNGSIPATAEDSYTSISSIIVSLTGSLSSLLPLHDRRILEHRQWLQEFIQGLEHPNPDSEPHVEDKIPSSGDAVNGPAETVERTEPAPNSSSRLPQLIVTLLRYEVCKTIVPKRPTVAVLGKLYEVIERTRFNKLRVPQRYIDADGNEREETLYFTKETLLSVLVVWVRDLTEKRKNEAKSTRQAKVEKLQKRKRQIRPSKAQIRALQAHIAASNGIDMESKQKDAVLTVDNTNSKPESARSEDAAEKFPNRTHLHPDDLRISRIVDRALGNHQTRLNKNDTSSATPRPRIDQNTAQAVDALAEAFAALHLSTPQTELKNAEVEDAEDTENAGDAKDAENAEDAEDAEHASSAQLNRELDEWVATKQTEHAEILKEVFASKKAAAKEKKREARRRREQRRRTRKKEEKKEAKRREQEQKDQSSGTSMQTHLFERGEWQPVHYGRGDKGKQKAEERSRE